jgi:hypothetical protein
MTRDVGGQFLKHFVVRVQIRIMVNSEVEVDKGSAELQNKSHVS